MSSKNGWKIVSGESHSCLIFPSQEVRCFGNNTFNQLGMGVNDGSILARDSLPILITGQGDSINDDVKPIKVSAGSKHTCILYSDQGLRCFGDNSVGQLGIGNSEKSLSFPQIIPISFPLGLSLKNSSFSAHGDSTCVILTDNKAYCVGSPNFFGEQGPPRFLFNSPVVISTNDESPNVDFISGGLNGTCIVSGSEVYCTGSLPVEEEQNALISPVFVSVASPCNTNITKVSVGDQNLCLQCGETAECSFDENRYINGVFCAGNKGFNIGLSDLFDVKVLTKSGPFNIFNDVISQSLNRTEVSCGSDFFCAILSDNIGTTGDYLWCAGDNRHGQLGIPDIPLSLVLTKVTDLDFPNSTLITTLSPTTLSKSPTRAPTNAASKEPTIEELPAEIQNYSIFAIPAVLAVACSVIMLVLFRKKNRNQNYSLEKTTLMNNAL